MESSVDEYLRDVRNKVVHVQKCAFLLLAETVRDFWRGTPEFHAWDCGLSQTLLALDVPVRPSEAVDISDAEFDSWTKPASQSAQGWNRATALKVIRGLLNNPDMADIAKKITTLVHNSLVTELGHPVSPITTNDIVDIHALIALALGGIHVTR